MWYGVPPGVRTWLVLPAVIALLLSAHPAPCVAQVLEGRVLDGRTRQPLAEAWVTLLHPDGSEIGEPVVTSDDGTFALEVPGAGEYYIRVERSIYTSVVDGIFEFSGPEGRLSVDVYMLPRVFEVEGIDVRVQMEQRRRQLRYAGFYERATVGMGDFITPEQIERQGPTMNVSDYLRRVPGVNFYQGLVLFRDPGGRSLTGPNGQYLGMCEPNVWLDGTLMAKAKDPLFAERGEDGGFDTNLERSDLSQSLDEYVNPQDVLGIEVYRRNSLTPVQWTGPGSSCGTILIWTKSRAASGGG